MTMRKRRSRPSELKTKNQQELEQHDKEMRRMFEAEAARRLKASQTPGTPEWQKQQDIWEDDRVEMELRRDGVEGWDAFEDTAAKFRAAQERIDRGAQEPKPKAPAKKAPAKKKAKKAPAKKAPAKKKAKKRPPGYRPPGWRPHPN